MSKLDFIYRWDYQAGWELEWEAIFRFVFESLELQII